MTRHERLGLHRRCGRHLGIDIRERLSGRSDLTIVTLDEARRKDAAARAEALNDSDFAILCLPDEAAKEAAALVRDGWRADHRRLVAQSGRGGLDLWLPRTRRRPGGPDRASRPRLQPGCYPTAFLALASPRSSAPACPADWPLTYNATSGYSGGGKAMIAEFEEGGTDTAFRVYALTLAHKHLPR